VSRDVAVALPPPRHGVPAVTHAHVRPSVSSACACATCPCGRGGPAGAGPGPEEGGSSVLGRSGKYLGVDIGSAEIKAVELAGDRPRLGVRAVVRAPVPLGTVRDGRIVDPVAVGRVLKDALARAGIRTRQAIASVSGQIALAREMRLPVMPQDELKEAARYEVEQYLPYPITEATYDTFVLGETKEDGVTKIEVLVVAAKTEALAQHVETLQAAGLEPVVIDVEPFALARAMLPPGEAEEARHVEVYLHIGATHTGILLVDGSTPRVMRTVAFGGNLVTQHLAEQLHVDEGQAEAIKRQLSDGAESADGVRQLEEIVADSLGDLTTEVRRSLDYYAGRYRGAAADRAIVTGGGAHLPGLTQRLAMEIEVPVEVGDPFRGLSVPADLLANGAAHDAAAFAVAVGLARRGANGA